MTVRKATRDDLDRVNSLLEQVLEVHADGRPDIFKHGTKKYSDSELFEIFENDLTPVFVAENESGFVCGYVFCIVRITENNSILKDRHELYIDDLCVDESCRGQGIGRRLFEYVEEYVQTNNFDSITLNVWSLNASAIRFYEKCGFSPLKITMEKSYDKD